MTRSNSRNILIALLIAPFLAVSCQGLGLADDLAPQTVVDQFQQTYPSLSFQNIYTSPVAGLYEVVSGNKVLYFSPATDNIIVGDMWNKDGVDLSKVRVGQIMAEKLKDIPLDKAIKIGNGKNIVIEITDPDCPYCRKASDFFSQRTDVTRYVFFLPLSMHPQAEEKVRFILSSENPAETYEDAMAGRYDEGTLPPFKDNGLFACHKEVTDRLNLHGTPNFWINGTYLSGVNLQAMAQLLH